MDSTWFSILLFRGLANQKTYLLTGLLLFPVKYTIDQIIASQFGRDWEPIRYLLWPDKESFFIYQLPAADRDFGLVMLAGALPFIWVGVSFTLGRLRDAGLPSILVLLFFVPIVNLLLILWLCLAPTRKVEAVPEIESPIAIRTRKVHEQVVGKSDLAAFLFACVGSTVFTALLVFLSANFLKSYGFGLFVGAPFALGWFASVLYGIPRRRSYADCMLVSTMSMLFSGMVLLCFAFEGIICLVMALPIASVLVTLGAATGCVMQPHAWTAGGSPTFMIGLMICMPGLIAAEARLGQEPELREIRTSVIIDAPPERVWDFVISFPPLPEPEELFFRTGVAYPQRATIEGTGVGAVRHCVFSTGPFVEPITVWDAPNKLAFDVTSQPEPMHELSPWEIHPPHLDHFLVSKRGQFLLERLPDGRTRLQGTTWYTNRMWPEFYWGYLADRIISSIHGRVLKHVKTLAEGE